MATQQIQLLPGQIQVGDEFFDRQQRRVRVINPPVLGDHSIYTVQVEIISPEEVQIDYTEKTTVTREAGA